MKLPKFQPPKEKISQIAKWGNSASVRLPAEIMEAAGYKIGDEVSISVEGDKILIGPAFSEPLAFDIEAAYKALETIQPADMPEIVSSGRPRGQEVW